MLEIAVHIKVCMEEPRGHLSHGRVGKGTRRWKLLFACLMSDLCLLISVISHLDHSLDNDMPSLWVVLVDCFTSSAVNRTVEECGFELVLEMEPRSSV